MTIRILSHSDEQMFVDPMTNPIHALTTYHQTYQYRELLPRDVFGTYLHSVVTWKTAFTLNKRYFDSGFELQSVHLVWGKMFEFHKDVLAGEWEPAEGEEFIWKVWYKKDCETRLLPPPNSKWFIYNFN
jgi:hypothetical protein